eukprot:TRINITY_DN1521_c0_g2_i10.p1 TRINITY_DN1521_c0_g2~~TRINITY_DN1521_c0_g2_i10.p1  ORF type:complete len:193 (-),score=9.13 TRINITY_DN1521_c0_g2_i10:204-782(-)
MSLSLDFAGIAFVISGASCCSTWIAFSCYPVERRIYVISACILGLLSLLVMIIPAVHKCVPRELFLLVRIFVLLAFVVFTLAPVIHWVVLNGLHSEVVGLFLWRILSVYVVLLVGFIIFRLNIPERFWVGRFDIWFLSHQWWHVFTFLGPFLQILNSIAFLDYYKSHPCPNTNEPIQMNQTNTTTISAFFSP